MYEEKPLNMLLMERLKAMRKACSLTQQQIADELGIDRSTYTYYESGRSEPSFTLLGRICDIYGIRCSALLDPDESDTTFFTADGEMRADEDKLNALTRDEKTLVIHFRRLTREQRREALKNFGVVLPKSDIASGKVSKKRGRHAN